jgi:hypothetical protein
MQLVGILFFALTIPFSAMYGRSARRRATLIAVTASIAVFGLVCRRSSRRAPSAP